MTYGTGGRWGQWSRGGGSSLELIDPHSNHRLAANWADSDETAKSVWTNIENTGVLDNGANYTRASIDLRADRPAGRGRMPGGQHRSAPGHQRRELRRQPGLSRPGLANWSLQGMPRALQPGEHRLRQQSLAAHPLQRPRLDRRQLRPGHPEQHHPGLRPDGHAAAQGALAARLAGDSAAAARQLARSRPAACPCRPTSARRACRNSRARDQCRTGNLSRSNILRRSRAANQPVVVTARFHDRNSVSPTLLYRIDTGVNPTPTYICRADVG